MAKKPALKKRRKDNFLRHGVSSEKTKDLEPKDIRKICEYLENPIKTGLWNLKIGWKEGISKEIKEELKQVFLKSDAVEVPSSNRKIKINLKKINQENFLDKTERVTFIFNLFAYMVFLESKDESLETYLEMEDSEDKIIFNLIDVEKLKKKYLKAYDFFKNKIYFDGFKTAVWDREIVKLKQGFFLYERDYEASEKDFSKKILLISLNLEDLELLRDFYLLLNKIEVIYLNPIYSPEEEVFTPYFSFLEQAYEEFIDNSNILRFVEKSIYEYSEENYSNCISAIGLIAEENLVQIYETLFRDICPKRLSLGQLYDQIGIEISRRLKLNKPPKPDFSLVSDRIKEIGQKVPDNKNLFKLIIEFFKTNKKIQEYNENLIISIKNPVKEISIFPKRLRENMDELIKNRNAISHRSRIPIGNYEALRTMYCSIYLILWWKKQKDEINWKKNPEEIIKFLVETNNY